MKYLALLFIPALLFFSGCTTIKVTSDVDKTVDFTKYKTFEYYGWQKDSDKLLNDLDKRRIEQAFGQEFKKRGLQYVKENGDLIVTLLIVTEKKTSTTANTTMMGGGAPYGYYGGFYGYGPGWGWGMGHATTTYSTYDYQVGTLVVDVFDAKEKKLIWEGIGQGTISDNVKNRDKNIPKAIAAIMKDYPVKPIEDK
jgi:hypothetical protein